VNDGERAQSETEFDLELVRSARDGNITAFNQLVLRHQDTVYTLCYRLSANAEDAADATQDAFLSAFRNLDSFRGHNFRAWLLRIAANACYDLHRHRKRRLATSLDATSDASDGEPVVDPYDPSPGPEGIAVQHELGELLQAGLMALPEDQRLAIVLCDLHGFDYQSIADTCGVELGTVKSRINRARRRLRDFLSPYRELSPVTKRPTYSE
jgi:RNA polymerase sigma factor (sigma-70 family)